MLVEVSVAHVMRKIMPNQPLTAPVPSTEDKSGLDSFHIKPLETKFQLKVDKTMAVIAAIILIFIVICGFVIVFVI